MTCYVGLDVSQKMTAICVVNEVGQRLWRGQCRPVSSEIEASVRGYAGKDARIGLKTCSRFDWATPRIVRRSGCWPPQPMNAKRLRTDERFSRRRDLARLRFHLAENRLQVVGCRLQRFRVDDPALLQFAID